MSVILGVLVFNLFNKTVGNISLSFYFSLSNRDSSRTYIGYDLNENNSNSFSFRLKHRKSLLIDKFRVSYNKMCLDNYALNCVEVTSSAEQMPANAITLTSFFIVQ